MYNNLKVFLILFTMLVILQLTFGFTLLKSQLNNVNNSITNNVYEYEEVDITQLCKLSKCNKVWYNNHGYVMHNDKLINIPSKLPNINMNKLNNLEWITVENYDIKYLIYNNTAKLYMEINLELLVSDILLSALVTLPIILLFMIVIILFNIRTERQEILMKTAGSEAIMANKSMVMITENIHHELNTPLEVIDSKISKIHNILNNFIIKETQFNELQHDRRIQNITLTNLTKDFNYITLASEQIYNILERMKGFKNLRYSNGNKSIYDICVGSFNITSMSSSNYINKIDDELQNYSIDSDLFNNSDLLNILLNHIKNSVEANSTKIYMLFSSATENSLTIRIIDNGNGIPKEAQKSIFLPNFSTKNIETDGVRGNGLHLNQSILKSGGGELDLISSNQYGTTFELTIPTKQH